MVTRVSSAAMKSTSDRTCAALGERSPRLPMGVPTTYNLPIVSPFPIDFQ